MPPKGVHRVVLADFKANKRDEGAIEIELDDGSLIRIDPPELWPDEAMKAASASDPVGLATALVGGPDEYQRFLAGGGTAAIVSSILAEAHGINVGESSASSNS